MSNLSQFEWAYLIPHFNPKDLYKEGLKTQLWYQKWTKLAYALFGQNK